METEDYEFCGVPLTPVIFGKLLIQLFDGKRFERQAAISEVVAYHRENGGIVKKGRNPIDTFKKATLDLRKKDIGFINKGYGVWELHYHEPELVEVVTDSSEVEEVMYSVDEILGTGPNAVYVYYYDVYCEFARIKGEVVWPCKIGRTDCDPIQRIIGQAGTCYPELPHVALIIYCDDSNALETAFHNIMKVKGRWMADAPGKEWFMTSPDELKAIYTSVLM